MILGKGTSNILQLVSMDHRLWIIIYDGTQDVPGVFIKYDSICRQPFLGGVKRRLIADFAIIDECLLF